MDPAVLQMFADYNIWANRQVYTAAQALDPADYNRSTGAFFGSLSGTLNHILATDRIWMKRFTGEGDAPDRLDVILHADLSELAAARAAEDARIARFAAGLTADRLEQVFHYTPLTNPAPVSQRLGPAVVHLFNHQTHHRGQAHMILTTLGQPSISLDMAVFQRQDGKKWA